jgi:hypothetical protein
MTPGRSIAYGRVTRTLRGVGAPELWPREKHCVREAADALLFCADVDAADVREALAEAALLADNLVSHERWTPKRAQRLLDDIWACGPGAAIDMPEAA